MQKTLQDSIKISKREAVLGIQAFITVRGFKRILEGNQREMHSKDVEIEYWKRSSDKFEKASDTLSLVNKTYAKLDTLSQVEVLKWKQYYKAEKKAKLAASIGGVGGIIVVGILSFVVGHYLR